MKTELIKELKSLMPTIYVEEWKNDLANDLEKIISSAIYSIEKTSDGMNWDFAEEAIRVIRRVKDFEEL